MNISFDCKPCALEFLGTLLSNSEIYIPRNPLAPASLPNLKYNFPKQKYKNLKKIGENTIGIENFILSFRFIYLEIERNQN